MRERDERWTMTLLDLIALVVGSALAFSMMVLPQVALRPGAALDRGWGARLPTWVAPLTEVPALGLPVAFSVAVVILARRLRDGRPLRAPEWLTLVGGLVLVVLALPSPRYDPHGLIRLGVELLVCAAGAAAVIGLGHRLPSRLRTSLLVGFVGLFLSMPATRAVLEVPELIRFIYPPGPTYVVSALPYRRHEALLVALGLMPWGLAVGVPLVAALHDERRLWAWTDWVGVTTAVLMLPSAVALFVLSTYPWESEPIVLGLYLVAVGAGSLAMVRGLSPWWRRRVALGYDRGRPDSIPEGGHEHGTSGV